MRIKNLVKNHCLAKSINDAGWYQFRKWLEHFGIKLGKITVAVNPAYTTQNCSNCGTVVKKSLSTRTHICECGLELDRDWNAARNILNLALGTTGHVGTWILNPNASGDSTSTLVGSIQSQASWVYERRIPSPLGMGVSNECYSATSASASASGASGTSCLIVK